MTTLYDQVNEHIEQFIKGPAFDGGNFDEWKAERAARQSAALCHLLGTLGSMCHPQSSAPAKADIVRAVTASLDFAQREATQPTGTALPVEA